MTTAPAPIEPRVATLANGVRVLTIALPQADTCSVSVFVRSGSAHENAHDNGISHFVEHMVFKGTATRDRRQWNAQAEALGPEVNAHTDKDHTAFHMRGFGRDALAFVDMLADLVQHASFPAGEVDLARTQALSALQGAFSQPGVIGVVKSRSHTKPRSHKGENSSFSMNPSSSSSCRPAKPELLRNRHICSHHIIKEASMAQAKQRDTVQVNYTGKLPDGTVFDTSYGRHPLQVTLGQGRLIAGFEKAVVGMNTGDRKTVSSLQARPMVPGRTAPSSTCPGRTCL